MDNLGRMKIFHSFEDLVHDVSVMQILKYFLSNGVVEISLHEFEHQVQVFIVLCFYHIMHLDYVGMG